MTSRARLSHHPDVPLTLFCPYVHTWQALHLVPCSTSLRRGKKWPELRPDHESTPIGAPVRWAPDGNPMGVIGPHRAPSNSRSDGLLCRMVADGVRWAILAEADDDCRDERCAPLCTGSGGKGASCGNVGMGATPVRRAGLDDGCLSSACLTVLRHGGGKRCYAPVTRGGRGRAPVWLGAARV